MACQIAELVSHKQGWVTDKVKKFNGELWIKLATIAVVVTLEAKMHIETQICATVYIRIESR